MYLYEDYGWRASLDLSIIQENEEKARFTYAKAYKMAEGGIEQSGYIDIKQPPRIKGRKLKTWKKKWVVLHEMSIRAADKSAAKVDVYADKKTATTSPSDKQTFILEFVTEVRPAKSKNREHAFEIIENEAVLVMAGDTEFETQTWMTAFQKIFWPNKIDCDCFTISIIPNEHTRRLSLEGAYNITITPEVIGIESRTQNSYEWSLSMLKRFHLEKDTVNPSVDNLTIECGPKSECGEATFKFRSDKAAEILDAIKRNIVLAINSKKAVTSSSNSPSRPQMDKPWRESVTSNASIESDRSRSATVSSTEQRFRDLLENQGENNEYKRKRTRLLSTGSENSKGSFNEQLDTVVSETTEAPSKSRPTVTFETPPESTVVKDLLSEPIDTADITDEIEYNRAEFNPPKTPTASRNIISTFTVARPGYQTRVLLDDTGYSHVNLKNSVPVIEDGKIEDKTRSLSNISSHSSMSCRSASIGSRDSGILYQRNEEVNQPTRRTLGSRSTNSFDSAVSTSSTVEQGEVTGIVSNQTQLTVEIEEIVVSASGMIEVANEHDDGVYANDNDIYQDVSLDEGKIDNVVEANANSAHLIQQQIKKSNSTGNFKHEENHYEDLEQYRKGKKNLFKHLGMDPKVDPASVPPSLPARPLSHKVKRKFNSNDKRMFTLPFARNRNRKTKERANSTSSSSESDTESLKESKKNRKANIAVKAWPLGNKSIMVENDELYQPVAIERFLNDNEENIAPHKRERSSSLNLNVVSSLKRPSLCVNREVNAVERRTAMWKHNRNVSMHVDLMNRNHDPDTAEFNSNLQKFDMSLRQDLGQPFDASTTFISAGMSMDQDKTTHSVDMSVSDNEPIYAEVQPICKNTSEETEEPFPNLDSWKPPVETGFSNNSALDDTHYENDDSMNSVDKGTSEDIFNQGFVSEQELSDKSVSNVNNVNDVSSDNMLIDISVDDSSDTNVISTRPVSTAADIFAMGMDPLNDIFNSETTPTQTTNQSVLNQTKANFVDMFTLGVFTPLPQSQSDLLSNELNPVEPDTSGCENKTSFANTTNWADFSTFENKDVTNTGSGHESIYMDMSVCKNESIYVMPSSLNKQNDK